MPRRKLNGNKVLVLPLLRNCDPIPALTCEDDSETIAFWGRVHLGELRKQGYSGGDTIAVHDIVRRHSAEEETKGDRRERIVLSRHALREAKKALTSGKAFRKWGVLCVGYEDARPFDVQLGVTGTVHRGEGHLAAGQRELQEETGLCVAKSCLERASRGVYTVRLA